MEACYQVEEEIETDKIDFVSPAVTEQGIIAKPLHGVEAAGRKWGGQLSVHGTVEMFLPCPLHRSIREGGEDKGESGESQGGCQYGRQGWDIME